MPRIAKAPDPLQIARLKKQVHEPEYMDYAIARIATGLTDQIIRREMQHPTLVVADEKAKRD